MHLSPAKEKLVAGGERGGKSRGVAQEAFGLIADDRPGRYGLAGNKYEDTEVEFEYLVGLFQSIAALPTADRALQRSVKRPQDRSWRMELQGDFDGTVIETKSVAEVSNLKARSFDGLVLCEASLILEEAFKRAQGRIGERDGWITASGTFEKAQPWYAVLHDRWKAHAPDNYQQAFSLPTADNPVLFPQGRQDQRYLRMIAGSDQDRIDMRFEGKTVPNRRRVFPQFDVVTHIVDAPFVPARPNGELWPVCLAIDPGWANYAVLAVQVEGEGHDQMVYVRDEVFGHNMPREEVILACQQRDWWGNVTPTGHVIDIAGKQHQQSGETEVSGWHALTGLHIDYDYVKLEDGIDRLAAFLQSPVMLNASGAWVRTDPYPRLYVHRSCEELAQEFAMYQYPDNQEAGERRLPIDKWNHGLKALGYWLNWHYTLPGESYGPIRAEFTRGQAA